MPQPRHPASTLFLGASDVVACYTIQAFRYDASNTTLLMPDCIDGTDPTQSPYLLEDGFEDA